MTVLLIDNYDSFVYNLARYVQLQGYRTLVKRNDAIAIADIVSLCPSHIIISPGPCTPYEAGISIEVIRLLGKKIPILGVCLGHQAIAIAYGGIVTRAKQPMHGKASLMTHDNKGIFASLPNPLRVGRYHSLIVESASLPKELIATAWSDQNEMMALHHQDFPVIGVQFHPESILTEQGDKLIQAFLRVGETMQIHTQCQYPLCLHAVDNA